MSTPAYQTEPWFAMLQEAIHASSQSEVGRQLGMSHSAINMVLRGTGAYGSGKASTARIAQRVTDTYGRWVCPFLTDSDQERVVTAAQCRSYAHREAPTGSPRDLAHWRACRDCANRERSAPPVTRVDPPRRSAATTPAVPTKPTPEAS